MGTGWRQAFTYVKTGTRKIPGEQCRFHGRRWAVATTTFLGRTQTVSIPMTWGGT